MSGVTLEERLAALEERLAAAELAATRARGYGVCAGELESSLFGVSAPVLDRTGRPLAVLSIWGPKDRVHEDLFPQLGAIAVRAAAEVATARSAAIGGPLPPDVTHPVATSHMVEPV